MKAVLQRVTKASVSVGGETVGKIGQGLVVLVGVAAGDTVEDVAYLAQKTVEMRIFSDSDDKFNLSVRDAGGGLLLVSQFTLLASTRKGRRPGFTGAAPPDVAEELFNKFVAQIRGSGLTVETGRFQQHMLVEINNDGPVTIVIDSKERLTRRDK